MQGLDWRSWTAADRAAVAYHLLRRQLSDSPGELRELLTLVGDKNALAVMSREIMGQARTIVTDL